MRAQLLDAARPGDVVEVAEQLGYVKIDPTATIAPCEQTTLWSRIGWSYEPGQLRKAAELDRLLFEFDGCFRPISLLPLMLPTMRSWPQRASSRQWLEANARFRAEVLARLRADGPLRAAQIADTAQVERVVTPGWYGSSQVPHMLDFLHRQGEVAVAGREGRHRIWDLAERVYPRELPDHDPEEAARLLDERRLQAAGMAKERSPWTRVGAAGEPVRVEGSAWRYRIDPAALAALDEGQDAGGRAAVLNPYDSILFDRPRLKELFDFDFVLEQFKPKAQRRYGYFAHPILVGDRFVGLLDAALDKSGEVLQVAAVHELVPLEPEEREMVHAEIEALAQWLSVGIAGLG